jgi:hypothetical protein
MDHFRKLAGKVSHLPQIKSNLVNFQSFSKGKLQQVQKVIDHVTPQLKQPLKQVIHASQSIKAGYRRVHLMKLGAVIGGSVGLVGNLYQIGHKGFDPQEGLGLISGATLIGGFCGYYHPYSYGVLAVGGAMCYYGYATRK